MQNTLTKKDGVIVALIKCPECNTEISDQSKKCIKCGYPLKKNDSKKGFSKRKIIITIICLIVIVFVIGVGVIFSNSSEDVENNIVAPTEWIIELPTRESTEPLTENSNITVPSVVKCKKDTAINVLKRNGLDYKILEISTLNENFIDQVLGQFPDAGLEIEEEQIVSIGVAVDKRPITLAIEDWELNSVGGLDLEIKFTNNTDKGIKYIDMYVETYNGVGDPVYCSIRDVNSVGLRFTGELKSGETTTANWDAIVYNHQIATVVIKDLEIEYMDGSKEAVYVNSCSKLQGAVEPNVENFDLNISFSDLITPPYNET